MRYPNLKWQTFENCSNNFSDDFEDMCRRLFTAKYLKNTVVPHANHNTPGIEVEPILEPIREDGQPQKRISFQSKYCVSTKSAYDKFQKSAVATVEYWKGRVDIVYLFCNRTLTRTSGSYKKIENVLKLANIEAIPVSNRELLDLVAEFPQIAITYFGENISSQKAKKIKRKYLEMMKEKPFPKELCIKCLADIYVSNEYTITKDGEVFDDLLYLISKFVDGTLVNYLISRNVAWKNDNQLSQNINTLIITAEQCFGKSTLIAKILHDYSYNLFEEHIVYVASYRDSLLNRKDISLESICNYFNMNMEGLTKSVIILDGIDESDLSVSQIQQSIEKLSYDLQEYDTRLLITCRENTLDNRLNNSFTIKLCPFSDSKIREWINKCDFKIGSNIISGFYDNWINAPSHIRVPHFFKISIEKGLKLDEIDGLSQLYDKAFLFDADLLYSNYDSKSTPRLYSPEVKIMKEIILDVAFKCAYSDDRLISEEELNQCAQTKNILRMNDLIFQFFLLSHGGRYGFTHDSLLNYLFAYRIFERLINNENNEEAIASFILDFVRTGILFSKDVYDFLQHHLETHAHKITISFVNEYIKKYLSKKFDKYIKIEGTYTDIKKLYYACFVFIVSVLAAVVKANPEKDKYDLLSNLNSHEINHLISLSNLGDEVLSIINIFSFDGKELDGFNFSNFDFTENGHHAKAIRNVSFRACNFNNSILRGCYLLDSDLTLSKFNNAECGVLQLNNCVLSGCDFRDAKLGGAMFEECNLSNVDLRGAKLSKTKFVKTNLNGVKIDAEQLKDILDLFPDDIRKKKIIVYKNECPLPYELLEDEFNIQRPVAYQIYRHPKLSRRNFSKNQDNEP